MVKIPFTKMHGLGNDYIYFDCLKGLKINSPNEWAIRLSNRHTGIGSDGIVLIEAAVDKNNDAGMRMFNADGSEGAMCGNAIRCVGKYLYDTGAVKKTTFNIETKSGVKVLELTVKGGQVVRVMVDMGAPILDPKKIPVNLEGSRIVNKKVKIAGGEYAITCVSMGNPHAVVFMDNIDGLDLEKIGPKFEYDKIFPERVNTEFVEILGKNQFKMRVWERGSGETMACGTGACAVAVAAVLNGYADKNTDITINLKGGDLIIRYTDDTVFMTGGAEKVYDGVVEI